MMKIFLILTFLLNFGYLSKTNCKVMQSKIIGVKIYSYNGNFKKLFNEWKRIDINTVFASVDLLSNNEFKKLAKLNNIKTFVILPIFYAPEELKKDSTLFAITKEGKKAKDEWVKFVCPSRNNFIENKIRFIENFVKENNPTGISLDFIRHFVFWEKVYPETDINQLPNTCFDDSCLTGFTKSLKISFPKNERTEMEKYKWIKKNYYSQWMGWKSDLITKVVKKIVKRVKKINPAIKVNLHAVPWRQKDFNGAIKKIVGQDFKELARYVDYISPMTYSHMVKRKPEWIHSVVEDIKKESGSKIIPSIQVDVAYLNDTLSVDEFEHCITESLKEPSSGVIFWNWKSLAADKNKLELLERIK